MAAYALTWLQIINRVLVRMRESTVSNYNDTDYSTHIGQVVNAVKAEIEGAHRWHALRDTFTVSTTNNTSSYSLTDAGAHAQIIDGWNTTQGLELTRGTRASFNSKFFGTGSASVQTGSPTMYLPSGLDGSYDLTLDVWPIPVTGSLDTLKFNVYVPQDDLAANGDITRVPQDVLIEEVVARMKNERGDEDAPKPIPGETFILRDLLAGAIAADGGHDDSEYDWTVE